ncbi:TonB-dependent receptor plug domain-containing protein [Pseudoalteromonas umbrosa]|uniref:TonB-dependent receptor plug domain-containing protein n=1 Tax=Pseudoalteromonas umbrosa TaxID=3048489 RepID=UPI0024C36B12|nr:TonB-dependent receptor [Pseudoalteromonas sp. B95]MDK1287294.1 TonB-dependent receptor [Pseudoalteromonas sp. B95]
MLNTKVTKAVRIALAFGAASSAAFATNAVAAEGAEKVERIEVTGSRIKRVDMEGASPVEVITTAEFESQGRVSVADALQSVTSNSFGSFSPASGSGWQSQSTVSLLGAGQDRTLVLVDGKRMAGSPSLGGSAANLSAIPMAAVERIEILKDGASAIYGSDAIAGVINVILKKDYEGASFDIQVGRPEAEGADSKQMSLAFGISSDKGNITFVYDHQTRNPIFERDRDYTKKYVNDDNGDGVIVHGEETIGVSLMGATFSDKNGVMTAAANCEQLKNDVPGFVGTLGTTSGGTVCGYSYADVAANSASTQRDSVMTSMTYNLTDDLELYTRAMLSRNDSFGRYAPPAATIWNMPADHPLNELGEDGVNGHFRWYQVGNRDTNVTDYQQDYMIGLKGFFGETAEYEIAYHKAKLDYRRAGRNYLSSGGLAYNFDRVNDETPIVQGSEEWNNNLATTVYVEDQNELNHIFGGVSFAAGELEGGEIQHYIGAEYFDQELRSQYDAQSEAGLVGGSAGSSSAGERDTKAVFYEIAMPVLDNLILSAAYRYDRYSDFGSKGTPSFKVEYRPMDDLLVRGSYSKGFRAPSLNELLAAPSESHPRVIDYVKCEKNGFAPADCKAGAVSNLRNGNKNLGPEESTYINAGIVYSGFEDVGIKLDFFSLEIDNVISLITVQDLMNADYAGVLGNIESAYPGVNLDRHANGNINGLVTTRYENGSFMSRKGLDLDLSYRLDTSFGEFKFKKVTTYILEAKEDVFFGGPSQDTAGAPETPEWRSQLSVNYSIDNVAVNWTTDIVASTAEDEVLTVENNDFFYTYSNHNPTYVVHNLNTKYFTEGYGTWTLGVRNLFDKGVVLDDANRWVNYSIYGAGHIGREIFAGYNVSF